MRKSDTAYVIIGKIGSTYGVHGWLKIHSYAENGVSILDYSPWFLAKQADQWEIIPVEATERRPNGIYVKFAGIHTPETARLLTGKTIAIKRSQLPPLKKDEFYWSDLEGLSVINQRGESLGKVMYLVATGANDVLIVKGDKEFGIPYLPGTVIRSVDLDKREIHVDWELL